VTWETGNFHLEGDDSGSAVCVICLEPTTGCRLKPVVHFIFSRLMTM